MGINENVDCVEYHDASLIIFDYSRDKTWLECRYCGKVFDDPDLVNQALIIVLQTRFREFTAEYETPPSRDRPYDN